MVRIGAVGLFLFVSHFTYKDIVENPEKAHKSEIQRVGRCETQVSLQAEF